MKGAPPKGGYSAIATGPRHTLASMAPTQARLYSGAGPDPQDAHGRARRSTWYELLCHESPGTKFAPEDQRLSLCQSGRVWPETSGFP